MHNEVKNILAGIRQLFEPARRVVCCKSFPLAVGWLILTFLLLLVYSRGLSNTGGSFCYVLDDAYIHMSIARNLAMHGVWGVTREAFSSSSSSPLWTLLLAGCFAVVGPNSMVPFWLNIVMSYLLVAAAWHIMLRRGMTNIWAGIVLIALVVCVPMMPIVFAGMEHVLHALLAIVFLDAVSTLVTQSRGARWGWPSTITLVSGVLLAAVRYEGLFLVAVAGAFLACRQRLPFAVLLGSVSLAPLAIFGMVSVANGWPPLPVPLLLKTASPSNTSLLAQGFLRAAALMREAPHLLSLLMLAMALLAIGWAQQRRFDSKNQVWLALFVCASLLHAAFARWGWFFRYEAYLMALGIIGNAAAMRELIAEFRAPPLERLAITTLVASVVTVPLFANGFHAVAFTPGAARNVHEQMTQMGRFLGRYYPGASVAANDIGAINWYADLKLLDTLGLGSLEVATALLHGGFSSEDLERLAAQKGVEIAVVYADEQHLPDGVPRTWRWIESWRIRRNIVCGSDQVFFFAVSPGSDERLRHSLDAFAPELPVTVVREAGIVGVPPERFARARVDSR